MMPGGAALEHPHRQRQQESRQTAGENVEPSVGDGDLGIGGLGDWGLGIGGGGLGIGDWGLGIGFWIYAACGFALTTGH